MRVRSYDWVAHHAHSRGGDVAMIDLATQRRHTWQQFDDRVSRLAAVLGAEFGIGYRDRVAVLAHNTTKFFEVQFACARLGAIMVPLNWRLAASELEYIVDDSKPSLLLHDRARAEMAAHLATLLGAIPRLDWDGDDDFVTDYEDALASSSISTANSHPTFHDDVLTIMYTSGTTGAAKGAMITHGMTFWNAVNVIDVYALDSRMVNLAFLPLFHTGGLNMFANPSVHLGGTNVVLREFDPAHILRLLGDAELGITHFIGVPTNYLLMSQAPEFTDATFPTLVAAAIGGAPTPRSLITTWAAKGVALQQAYGMTETSPLVIGLRAADATREIGAAGKSVLHTEVRVVDENGNDVTTGETGELWVRGPNVTPGYWNRPEATAESITDGWLHTGDAVRVNGDGFYYVVDRWKDMYISGGENVYPAEVENVLYQLDAIAEAAVVGVADDRWGEVGRAYIVCKPDRLLTEHELIAHCRQHLASYKSPKSVCFLDELPHNATGKILKRELRDLGPTVSSRAPGSAG
jgi:fatty-acyl-CoA synthase